MATYGHDRTIHRTEHLDVEVRDGRVVSAWFRCMLLPFEQHDVDEDRAREMRACKADHRLVAVEVEGEGFGASPGDLALVEELMAAVSAMEQSADSVKDQAEIERAKAALLARLSSAGGAGCAVVEAYKRHHVVFHGSCDVGGPPDPPRPTGARPWA